MPVKKHKKGPLFVSWMKYVASQDILGLRIRVVGDCRNRPYWTQTRFVAYLLRLKDS